MKRLFLAGVASIFLIVNFCVALEKNISDKEFGFYVLEFLRQEYKEKSFQSTDDYLVIKSGESHLGLDSLLKKFHDYETSKEEFRSVVREHFDAIFSQLEVEKEFENVNWETAKGMLRPMFAPLEYADKIDIFHTKIDSKVMAAYVIDSEKSYRYVSREDIKRWGVSGSEIMENAGKNLGDASRNTPMQGNLNEVKFLIIHANDGYDAARLLSPGFRDFLGSKLGYPFHAGIPNRDFLIVWAIENPEDMKTGFAQSIKSDFNEKPYPLTPNVLVVSKESIVAKK